MTRFMTKAAPSTEKLRGGYYTPAPLADFIAEWVSASGGRLLEPSCGDGRILRALAARSRDRSDIDAVELLADEAAKAEASSGVPVHRGDFFGWFTPSKWGRYDGVAGNPPYIRFGNWPEPDRLRAMAVLERVGLKPSRLTNAWLPFTVSSVEALRAGGRFGLVLPAELLQVSYARQLREYLVRHCTDLVLISFRRLVFHDVLQEVVLLLGVKGDGPAVMRALELEDAGQLPTADACLTIPAAPMLQHDDEKWTKYFLSPEQIQLLRAVREGRLLPSLGNFATVEVGVVTGRNSFFTMTPSQAQDRGLVPWCVPLVSRSAHLRGALYTVDDLSAIMHADERCMLLKLADVGNISDAPVNAYLREGESHGVHEGYKCSIRDPWWVVPSTWRPDGFMLRQIHRHPLLVANRTEATSTDTVHRVRLTSSVTIEQLIPAVFNSATLAFAEVLGRSYGGGILELEPSEARALPVAPPDSIDPSLADRIDKFLRAGDTMAALDLVDSEVLVGTLDWDPGQVALLRRAWEVLRDRRLDRPGARRRTRD